MSRAALWRGERGLSLIEVMIALAILTTVLISLGGLMYQVANQTKTSANATYRSAALQSSESWVQGLSWDTIPNVVGCTNDTTGTFTYTRCTTYSTPSTSLRRMTVIVTPTGSYATLPETLVIDRTRPKQSSTLNMH